MAGKILDNGALVTLGIVGAVAAVGAANKAGLYGSQSKIQQTYTDKAGDRIFSGKSAKQNHEAAEAFASGLRARVFTSPVFKRFIESSGSRWDGVGHHRHAFEVTMIGDDAIVDQGVLIDFGETDGNVYVNGRMRKYQDLLESVANIHGYSIFD
jgi:hypothetical protein